MTDKPEPSIDKFIHEPVRLMILSRLATSTERHLRFNDLKDALNLSGGNLSIQLRNLEDAGYVEVDKRIENRRTLTLVSLTSKGLHDFMQYLDNMERIIRSIKD